LPHGTSALASLTAGNHDGIMNGRVSALRVMRLRTRQQRS
jgi:hypothetical protein